MVKNLYIFGSRETATIAKYYFESFSGYAVKGFTVDDDYVSESTLEGLPVVPWSELDRSKREGLFDVHVALSYEGMNSLRKAKFEQVSKAGFSTPNFIHPSNIYPLTVTFGRNCLVLENQVIQTNVSIGNNVMIWSGNHIGHGASIGDNTYISSHVVLAGHSKVGESCFLGVNSAVRDHTKIGDRSFVAMGANVINNLGDGSIVLAPKSESLEKNSRVYESMAKRLGI